MTGPSPAGYGTVFCADADPVVKYDGDGQPVHASQLPGNRATRRAAAREARRRDRG